MEAFLHVQSRLVPDLVEVMQQRFQLLQYIRLMEPIGRRTLAANLDLTERVVRREVQFLQKQNLLVVSKIGISLTIDGKEVLEKLQEMMRVVSGIRNKEAILKRQLNIQDVVIVPGDVDKSPWVKKELGRLGAETLAEKIENDDVIAVTGGSTADAVANKLTTEIQNKNPLFVPARGAIGQDVKNQANTICAKMAENTGTTHRTLYIPDQVSETAYDTIIHEPAISEVLQLISSANIVLHGIGDAILMAQKRNTEQRDLEKITQGNAAGEAFGYYFDMNGTIVHNVQTIGLQLQHLEKARTIIAVAGGSSKGKAIKAYMRQAPATTILITDEGAARALIDQVQNQK